MPPRLPDHLKAVMVPVAELLPLIKNPRRGDVDFIRASVKDHGQYTPLIVRRETSEILKGNHTYHALVAEGMTHVAVVYRSVPDDQAAAKFALRDNRASDRAGYDPVELAAQLQELDDLTGSGFEQPDLTKILKDADAMIAAGAKANPQPEPVPERPSRPVTRLGDLIMLGEHRLLCGDSHNASHLQTVYEGLTVGCVLTDPPYGINLDTDYSQLPGGNANSIMQRPGKKYRPVAGDDQPFDAAQLRALFAGTAEQFWFGGDYYRRTLSDDDLDGSWLVWDKRSESSDTGFGSGFELIWSARRHKRDLLRHFYFGAFGVEAARRSHPTQKPSPLLAEILQRWAPEGCIVADPFLGSGSTLIACENTDRICAGLELDPGYCDVIVTRWEQQTGQTAQRPKRARTRKPANPPTRKKAA